MKVLKTSLLAAAMAALLGGAAGAGAQMNNGSMGNMPQHAADQSSLTDGEIRKIDREQAKLTIKHGDIKNLDMPGMTMVFNVRDKNSLDKFKVGDKIRFAVVMENGKMVITEIRVVK
jgi:Cu/Ag efflux protein CusF